MPYKDPEAKRAHDRAYYAANKEARSEYKKQYYESNKEHCLSKSKEWARQNRDKTRIFVENWRQRNKGRKAATEAKRRAAKLKATPLWADYSVITQFYEECPEGHQVDHVIPLQGKLVTGLHVIQNLQYLKASENASKSNSFTIGANQYE
jgi:hypothetical protein